MTLHTFTNVNFIDIAKISNDSKYVLGFNFIKDNEVYFSQWSNEKNVDSDKGKLITKLQQQLLKNLLVNLDTTI